ncbi:31 kDa ribonucleoprotein, chloroplastic-like [Phalaenopsis equestris]|uniref:31 kDa ribonucleoprotein, chloroplastic-like n=1 Tax=Phalaenopsis equestris TaxID=78828 RepID=UPI0009E23207|nr:31 kDa ribonucleoprotein, chloroplastic-like [Phalaenopsis equestris]
MAAAPVLKPAISGLYLANLSAPFGSKSSSHSLIPFPAKPTCFLRLSCSSSRLCLAKRKVPSVVSFVARTSDWARQDEEEEIGDEEEDIEWEGENEGFGLLDGEGPEDGFSEWEGGNRGVKGGVDAVIAGGDKGINEGDLEEEGDDSFPEPPEEAKLFVGNLPYDVDSEKLAHLFEKAGIVEVAEVNLLT